KINGTESEFFPLHTAIIADAPKALGAFIRSGAPVVQDSAHRYPFDLAVEQNNLAAIDVLMQSLATQTSNDWNTFKNCNQNTLFHVATILHQQEKDDSTALIDFSNEVILQCAPETIHEFIKKGFLCFPVYPNDHGKTYHFDSVCRHL